MLKLLDLLLIHFQSYFQWAKYKVYDSSFEIIFQYVSSNQHIHSLHVCVWAIFQTTFSLISESCYSNVMDNSEMVMCFVLLLFWLDKAPFKSCNHLSCLLILFGSIPVWADSTPTVRVWIQSVYQPCGDKRHTWIIMQLVKLMPVL